MMKQTLGNTIALYRSRHGRRLEYQITDCRGGFHAFIVSTYIVIPTANDILLPNYSFVTLSKWTELTAAQLPT
jgi:hypothetical protein